MARNNALVYSSTNVGGYFFDAYLKLEHKSELQITSHPVETGADIVDHSYLLPKELTLEIGMSDAVKSKKSGQFNNANTRSISAYQILTNIQAKRSPVVVYTKLQTYNNMLIKTVTATDDSDTAEGLKASVTLVEIPLATLQTVKVSLDPQTTNSTKSGAVEPSAIDNSTRESLLYQMTGKIY